MKVFVYGTLMTGMSNHRLLAGQQFAGGDAATGGGLAMVDCGSFPGLVDAPGHVLGIVGEAWEVDDGCLTRLDRLEGVPHHYRRGSVALASGGEALAYILQPKHAEGCPVVEGGDWRGYLEEKRKKDLHPANHAI